MIKTNCRIIQAYARYFVVLVNLVPKAVFSVYLQFPFSLPKPALYVLSMYEVSPQIKTKLQSPLVNFLYTYKGFANQRREIFISISEVIRRHHLRTFRRSEDFRVSVSRYVSANTNLLTLTQLSFSTVLLP